MLRIIEGILMVNQAYVSGQNTTQTKESSNPLDALKLLLQDIPEINEARVIYFKTEVNKGNYSIDSNKIARTMLKVLESMEAPL